MGLAHSPSIVTSNLFLALDAANRKSYPGSGTTWSDLSGNGNNGTIINAPTHDGKSFTFTNASQQLVSIPYRSQWRLIGNNSISFWTNAINTGAQAVIGYQKGGWEGYYLLPSQVVYSGQSGSNDTTASFSKSAGEWAMLTWVVDRTAGQYRLYKNATLATTSSITHPDLSGTFSSGILSIGNSAGSSERYFTGSISIVNFYTKALNAEEVAQNFNAVRGRYGI
jgi:hypothetical protein